MDNPAANLANDLGALSLTPAADGTTRPASRKLRNPGACLTGLPPELRLVIYDCVIEDIEQQVLPYNGRLVVHPLAQTNRLLRKEFLPVFEGSDFPAVTTIEASIKNLNFRLLNLLWRRIAPSFSKIQVWANLLITSEAVAKTHIKDVAEWCSFMDTAFVEASRGQKREFYWMSDSSDSEGDDSESAWSGGEGAGDLNWKEGECYVKWEELDECYPGRDAEDDSESDWSGGEGAGDFYWKEGEGYVRCDKANEYYPGRDAEDDDVSWREDDDEEDDDGSSFEWGDKGGYGLSSEDDDHGDTSSEVSGDKVTPDERPEYLRFPCGYSVILARGQVDAEQLDDLTDLLYDMSKMGENHASSLYDCLRKAMYTYFPQILDAPRPIFPKDYILRNSCWPLIRKRKVRARVASNVGKTRSLR